MSWWGTQLILPFARSGFGSRCFRLWRGSSLSTQNQDSSRTSSSWNSLSSPVTIQTRPTLSPLLAPHWEYWVQNPLNAQMAYICPTFWCKFSFLYNGNVLPCPLIFMFLAFPTPLMNHLSHEAFSRTIFLPEVFLFPSGNFHCGIYRSALSSSYESHPLGMNFLVAEDRFFFFVSSVSRNMWVKRNTTSTTQKSEPGQDRLHFSRCKAVPRACRVQSRTHRPQENWRGEKPKHQLCWEGGPGESNCCTVRR